MAEVHAIFPQPPDVSPDAATGDSADDAAAPQAIVRAATTDDIDAIHGLIEEASRTTTVLPRTRDNIMNKIRDFLLVELFDSPGAAPRLVSCGALSVTTRGLAEIKSLVVAPGMRRQGVGSKIIRALIEEGRKLGLRRIFALTDNPPFFLRLGFQRVDKATLPHKVWTECIHCSKFLNCGEEAVDIILAPAAAAAKDGVQ